jgi:transposase, IS5 family
MAGQAGFFDVEERLAGLSRKGDELERLSAVVDFELFRPELEAAVPRADRLRGGRPPFDHVLMFKVLVLQTQNHLSDERTEFYLRDRLTPPGPPGPGPCRIGSSACCARWIRFLGLGLGDAVPDANTIWTFREQLTKAGAIERLFDLFDQRLREAGYPAMSGQLVDATIVAAPKQRNTKMEKRAIKEGRIPEAWQAKPAKLRQKDRDARWTVKYTKAKPLEDGRRQVDLAIPAFGYQNHISTDRRHRLIRRWLVTDAAAHEGSRLGALLDPANMAAMVPRRPAGRRSCGNGSIACCDRWADSGYRSKKNEVLLAERMLVSRIHRKKPPHRSMPARTARANAKKSAVRAHIEHVFAEQKARMGLFVRTIERQQTLDPISEGDAGRSRRRRHRQSGNQDRAGQPPLQHAPADLARTPSPARLKASGLPHYPTRRREE